VAFLVYDYYADNGNDQLLPTPNGQIVDSDTDGNTDENPSDSVNAPDGNLKEKPIVDDKNNTLRQMNSAVAESEADKTGKGNSKAGILITSPNQNVAVSNPA